VSRLAVTNGSAVVVGGAGNPAVLSLSGSAVFSGGLVLLPGGTLTGWGTVSGAVCNYGLIAPSGAGLIFTNGGGFASVATNYAAILTTNAPAIFTGSLLNYARPGLEGSPGRLRVYTVGAVDNWLEVSTNLTTWTRSTYLGVGTGAPVDLAPAGLGFYRAVAAGGF